MNLINFIESFTEEASCRKKFKEIRDAEGVVCRKCGGKDHYWLATIEQYQCKEDIIGRTSHVIKEICSKLSG